MLVGSNIIAHLNATLQGLTTIRAFKIEEILIEEFNYQQVCDFKLFVNK